MSDAPYANDTVVVTGGGTGMGRAAALLLASLGCDVLICGRRAEPLHAVAAAAAAGAITPVVADASTTAGTEAIVAAVADRRLVGLVAAAGGQGGFYSGAADPQSVRDRWTAALESNLFPAILPAEALSAHLADGRGRVVLITSTAGLDGRGGPYATAKAAVHGYTRDLARRLGPRGITVNAVAPGFVADTDFFEAAGFGVTDERLEGAASATFVERVGTASEIAATVVHLLAPDAGFLTGQVISPNGGSDLVR